MSKRTGFWALLLLVFGSGLFLSASPWEKWGSCPAYPAPTNLTVTYISGHSQALAHNFRFFFYTIL
jgi:hypothetical protein